MNEEIIKRWNELVSPEDTVYVLGDLMLGDNNEGAKCLDRLNGIIEVVFGNHDTDSRKQLMARRCILLGYSTVIKYNGYRIYLSHYPTMVENFDKDKPLKKRTLNFYGHTHQDTNFYSNNPCMYHVGIDSHNLAPVLITDIIMECENKLKEGFAPQSQIINAIIGESVIAFFYF